MGTTEATAAAPTESDGWTWALVEIMGFRKHAGRIREEERYGVKMLRIDIPIEGDPVGKGWETRFYTGQTIFSLTPTDADTVMRANKPYAPPALTRYRPESQVSQEEIDDANEYAHDDDELPPQPPAPRDGA